MLNKMALALQENVSRFRRYQASETMSDIRSHT